MEEKILIEFVGLPGSGKTTIANELCKSNAEFKNIFPQRNTFKKPFLETIYRHLTAFFFIVKNPVYSYRLLMLVYKSEQITLNDFRATYINLVYKLNLYSKVNTDYISVLDEGALHAVMSILISSKNNQLIKEKVVKTIRFKNDIDKWIIIYVDNDDDTTFKRIQIRSQKSNNQHRILKYNLEEKLKLITSNFEYILDSFHSKYNIQIIKINNITIKESNKKILYELKNYFKSFLK